MEPDRASTEPERLVVGRIVKPHGIRGEVSVEVYSDAPERFERGARLDAEDGRAFTVTAARPHQGRLLVLFEQIADRNAAEEARGIVLSIPASEARALSAGSYYPHQLEGITVVDEEGEEVGVWVRALESPAHDVWVIRSGGREVLVPAVRDVVRDVNLDERRIVISVLPGLLD